MTTTTTTRPRRIPLPEHCGRGGLGDLGREYFPEAGAASGASSSFAMAMSSLDMKTREFLRLRCARVHDCRVCQSMRFATGPEDSYTEESELDKIDFYERSDLPEDTKVILRFADAYLTTPYSTPDEVFEDLLDRYTVEQVVEAVLGIKKWSTQKVFVSLGYDDDDPESYVPKSGDDKGSRSGSVGKVVLTHEG
jgi:hypothetical protein